MSAGEQVKERGIVRRMLGGFHDEALIEGGPAVQRAHHEAEVRELRLEAARRNPRWTEIEESVLVRRGPRGTYVHADSDEIYLFYKGAVFEPRSAGTVADQVDLSYYVSVARELVFLENTGETWTERLEEKARRELARSAPKPRPKWMDQ